MDLKAKAIQWNCQSINNKKYSLISLINEYDPFIICLQETWLKQTSIFKISGFSCLRADRPDGYGGVAILVKNSLSYSLLSLPSFSNDLSVIAVSVNNICFVSIYFSRPTVSIFNEINCLFNCLPKPFICLGDFNSHHLSWGCADTCSYGERLLEMIDSHGLCLLNTGMPTRITRPNQRPSAVDLTICTSDLASCLSWEPTSSAHGGDHFPIIVTFPFTKPVRQIKHPRIKHRLANADWLLYRSRVEQKIFNLPQINNTNVSVCSELFSKILIEAADESFPLKSSSSGRIPSPPWWDEDCTNAVRQRKEAEIKYCSNMTDENFDNYIIIANNTKELLRTKKFEGWKSFCSSLCPNVNPSIVWQSIRRFRSAFSDTQQCHISHNLAEQIMDRLAPPSAPEQFVVNPALYPSIANCNIDNNTQLNSPFIMYELKGVLSSVRDSAPGEDGIPYSFLAKLDDNSLDYFLSLVNSVVFTGIVPQSWRTQNLILLLKPNKQSSDPTSYRPIALASVLAKIAEHLVKNRLEWFLEHNNLLSNSQFGFRKSKSTMDSLAIFTTDIRVSFSRNDSLVAAFLDINAAYDNVNISILKNKLLVLNVPITLTNFIVNFLSERYIKYNLDSESNTYINRTVWKGLPQGSVLSPILYNLYAYDLESSINGYANVLQYADDLLLYVSGSSIDNICDTLSTALTYLKDWMDINGLSLSPSKSSVVLFSRKRSQSVVNILYDDTLLPVKEEVKFLGVKLDSKLTGRSHCDYVVTRCERNLNILRCLAGVWWGSHPSTMKILYNALIRSVLDYGTFLLHPGNVGDFEKLDRIQSRALRLIIGARRSSPINCLQVECHEAPLSLRRQYLCTRFFYRILQLKYHPLIPKLAQLVEEVNTSNYWLRKKTPCLVNSYNTYNDLVAPTHRSSHLPLFQYDYNVLITDPQIKYCIGISKNDSNQNLHFNHTLENNWPDYHYIYTDASKHSNISCVGVGVYHSQYQIVQKIKLPPQSSVFSGECFGILRAVEYALLMRLSKVIIFSDSLSALQALSRFPFRSQRQSPLIFKIRDLLFRCQSRDCTIIIAWIPSHVGIFGNERADQLANEAINVGDIFPYNNYCNDLISLSEVDLTASWNQMWSDSTSKGKHYRMIQQDIPRKPWFSKIKLNKTVTSVICRMRLGHVSTPAQLHKFNIVPDPLCSCGEYGDLDHIIFACPLYDRSDFISKLLSLRIPFPTSITCLLYNFDYDIYKTLALYIESNNIKV